MSLSINFNLCPSMDVLSAYDGGILPPSDLSAVALHLEGCSRCMETLQRLDDKTDPLLLELRQPLPLEPLEDDDECRRVVERTLGLCLLPRRTATGASSVVPGGRVGPYQILEHLGEGGMGAVYKARHIHLEKVVALKVLPPERVSDTTVRARFLLEMKAVGRLNHPNIVQALDAGVEEMPYLAMEFLEGVDLAKLVKRRGPLSVADACDCVRQAALGLQHAHEHGLVHRDLKPSNLLLTKEGVVKVLDLGLARLLPDYERRRKEGGFQNAPSTAIRDGKAAVVGTVDYIAPEQLLNSDGVDIRADLYSLGCTLYHLLSGQAPFAGMERTTVDKQHAHLLESVPDIRGFRPEVPESLAAILDRLLAKSPSERYATPAEVALALQPHAAGHRLAAIGDGAASAAPTMDRSAVRSPIEWKGSHRLAAGRSLAWIATIGLIGLGSVLVLLVFVWLNRMGTAGDASETLSTMEVRQVRASALGDFLSGKLGPDSTAAGVDEDAVKVTVVLDRPAYCYLVAFRPNGTEELCWPASAAEAPARKEEIVYPLTATRSLKGGGVGMQAFVFVASAQPLPPWSQWRRERGQPPWTPFQGDGVWSYERRQLQRISRKSAVGERSSAPAPLVELCNFFQNQSGIEAVSALAFPVRTQAPPLEGLPNP